MGTGSPDLSVVPNVTGFFDAQAALRATLGTPVTFKVPNTPEWPEGTKLNPITGEPYDGSIQQVGDLFTEVVKTCLVILKQGSPLRPQADTHTTALGDVSGMDLILDVADSDWADIADASELVLNGLEYHIREVKPFALAGTLYRRLIYAQER